MLVMCTTRRLPVKQKLSSTLTRILKTKLITASVLKHSDYLTPIDIFGVRLSNPSSSWQDRAWPCEATEKTALQTLYRSEQGEGAYGLDRTLSCQGSSTKGQLETGILKCHILVG